MSYSLLNLPCSYLATQQIVYPLAHVKTEYASSCVMLQPLVLSVHFFCSAIFYPGRCHGQLLVCACLVHVSHLAFCVFCACLCFSVRLLVRVCISLCELWVCVRVCAYVQACVRACARAIAVCLLNVFVCACVCVWV